MKKTIISFVLIVTFMFMCCTSGLAAGDTIDNKNQEIDKAAFRRFALVMGANDGGPRRVKLRYAVSDAKDIINVLEAMGGVLPDDSRLLVEPNRETFFREMKRLKERTHRARKKYRRVEVIFYYSGHSDEKNILLGKERISYQAFRDEINRVDADVRIAILDSCASGAFTRLKGGKKKPPFLIDKAYDMKGYAVMTSSSSDEASQESDRLKSSFFTHYLISGLRGAADVSRDGRITLSEAYQFAFNETLMQTEKTVSGPQHPYYNIQMSGTGDVVMTDIRKSSAILRLGKDVSGKLFVHNRENVLVVELNKPLGRDIELGLEQGKYRVINIVDGHIWEAKVKLPEGKTVELAKEQFDKSDKIDAVARGDLNARSQQRVFKKKGKKPNFFGAFVSKYTRAHGDGALMMGIKAGITFNRSLSVGYAAYANTSDWLFAHPTYWGVTVEYALPSTRVFNLRVGALVGSGKEEFLVYRNFFIVEPEISVTLNVSRLFNMSTGVSYRLISKDDVSFAPLSWCFSFRFGK